MFSRSNAEQSRITDQVWAVVERHGGAVLGDGLLTRETDLDARSILAALDLLTKEGKIRITVSPRGTSATRC
jgi:hypothetical protein